MSVLKATSYTLAHAPDMVLHNGTTQTTERVVNPQSEYLKQLPAHLRSFDQALNYAPNQCYLGNLSPEELGQRAQPWVEEPLTDSPRTGPFGEMMPQDELYLLMQACDMFDLLRLDRQFVAEVKPRFEKNPLMTADIVARIKEGVDAEAIRHAVNDEGAEGLYQDNKLVGMVKRAHDVDPNLSAHVMLENLASKATAVLSLVHLVKNSGVDAADIDYVIDCSEEACGDMNQRGGGNFAKAAAEVAGLTNATGCDVRGFCAAPAHAMVTAASLVKAGTFRYVAVIAGGCTAKLGMNGKDHVKKGLPITEDALAGFGALVAQDDGTSPVIDLDIVGRHTVGTGSSPQAVITSLVLAPLQRAGLTITDIDKYAAEMQNPDITKPAGAGNVPEANFKMIGALAVKNGDIERQALPQFIDKHGMVGWAPTQGHIPSGVPYLGFAKKAILAGDIKRAMIIGKGSLFLGRLTNLFDGISFVLSTNEGAKDSAQTVDKDTVRLMVAEAMRDFARSLGVE